MSFQYKRVLMIGATAGIGAAMADRLVSEGAKVIAVGRRQERLDDFIRKHGKDKASAVRFDIGDRQNMDQFVTDITSAYPDLDCVFLNSGIQSPANLAEPEKVDLSKWHSQITINFSCFVDLTLKFLPFLMKKETETSIVYTGSNLAFVPLGGLSAYSASKAALNSFILCLRDQLRHSTVKIIEMSPPAVQSELHDYMGDRGRQLGMPLAPFIDEAYKALASGRDQIIVGSIGGVPAADLNEITDRKRAAFETFAKTMRGGH